RRRAGRGVAGGGRVPGGARGGPRGAGGGEAGLTAGQRRGGDAQRAQREGQEGGRGDRAGAQQLVDLAGGGWRADGGGALQEIVGGVALGGDHDHGRRPGPVRGGDGPRHPAQARVVG